MGENMENSCLINVDNFHKLSSLYEELENNNTLIVFDFDGTFYNDDDKKISSILEKHINKYVILNSTIEKVKSKNRNAVDCLKLVAGEENIDIILNNIEHSDEYEEIITKKLADYFKKKSYPNHHTSFLENFGYSKEEICKRYSSLSEYASIFYEGIQNNPIIRFLFEKFTKENKVFICTDSEESVVRAGMKILGYSEEIIKKTKILSAFKKDKHGKVTKISSKMHDNSISDIKNFAIDNGFTQENIIFFDDNKFIVDKTIKNGIYALQACNDGFIFANNPELMENRILKKEYNCFLMLNDNLDYNISQQSIPKII